jgi:dihydroflavonol-4-reductase
MTLVTGATGHIGSVLVRELLSLGERVRALILPGEDCSGMEDLDIERVEGNVLDPVSLAYAMRGVDTVYHLAGIISIMPGKNEVMRTVNVDGTVNVARAAREAGVRRMVYTSSIHALGRPPHGTLIDESIGFDPGNPAGEYDRTKAEASIALLKEVESGLDAVLVCPTGVIGPYDFRRSEMGHLIRSWMKNRPHVFVDGWFDWVDARDIARGLILARRNGKKGEAYILGGQRVHLAELLGMVQSECGMRAPVARIPTGLALFFAPLAALFSRLTGSKPQFTTYSLETVRSNSVISFEKARRELGYSPRPFAETLRDTVMWWRCHERAQAATARALSRPAAAEDPVGPSAPVFQELVAVVTGASGGIGAATAVELAAKGYTVVLAARRRDRLEALAQEIERSGGKADVVQVDLAADDGPQVLHRHVTEKHGGADVLVNNAGFGWYGFAEEMPAQVARDMIQVNNSALVQLTLLFLPEMKRRRRGHIINISSVAGSIPSQGVAVYAATKSFVDSLTTALYRELGGSGVRVSAVRPGPVTTGFFSTAASLPLGRAIPAERFAVPPQAVARRIGALLGRPRRVTYVPRGLGIIPWIEASFGWLFDLLGPILLRRQSLAGARIPR